MNSSSDGSLDLEYSQIGKLQFKLHCQHDCVHVLRAMVEVIALRAGLNDKATNRVTLAVDELFANITCHGYNNKPGPVEFESKEHVNANGDQELYFIFRDFAPVVDVSDWCCGHEKPCDASELTPGGLGIQLIHSIMDVVEHKALANGNLWTLIYICKREIKGPRGGMDEA